MSYYENDFTTCNNETCDGDCEYCIEDIYDIDELDDSDELINE